MVIFSFKFDLSQICLLAQQMVMIQSPQPLTLCKLDTAPCFTTKVAETCILLVYVIV